MLHWTFDPEALRLSSEDASAQLTPKAAAVLECLMRYRGDVVSRDTLLAEVWPGIHVTEDLVRAYVFDLRAALEDDAKAPAYIETVRGKGFRLIGPVDLMSKETRGRAVALSVAGIRASIAVMRPSCVQVDWNCQAFADSIAVDIITELSQYHDLAVLSRNASFAVDRGQDSRDLAGDLDVSYLLESSFVVIDNIVRATFHLVDGRTALQLWARRFDHPFEDLLPLSDRIVAAVVAALVGWHGELHRAEYRSVTVRQVENLNAFEHFIRACDLDMRLDKSGINRALYHLDRSLELDQRFARAWVIKSAMLGWAVDILPDPEPDLVERSAEAIERAYALDPRDPATVSLYALKRARDGDLFGAAELARRAAASVGADADACISTAVSLTQVAGDFETAESLLNRALALNPSPPGWYTLLEARAAYLIGDYPRCVAATRKGTEHVSGVAFRALAQAQLGDTEAALNSFAELSEKFPRFDFHRYAARVPVSEHEALARFRDGVAALHALIPWHTNRRGA